MGISSSRRTKVLQFHNFRALFMCFDFIGVIQRIKTVNYDFYKDCENVTLRKMHNLMTGESILLYLYFVK